MPTTASPYIELGTALHALADAHRRIATLEEHRRVLRAAIDAIVGAQSPGELDTRLHLACIALLETEE